MPVIDLTYPAGALTPERRDSAVAALTAALLRHEGASDNTPTRMMSRAFVHELAADCIYVGGEAFPRPTYRVTLTVPAGTLLHGPGPLGLASRRALSREVTEIILEAEGTAYSDFDAGRIYTFFSEVPDDFWGGMGGIFRMEDIVAFADEAAPQTENSTKAREVLTALSQ